MSSHLVTPAAAGLFQRAIAQSGSVFSQIYATLDVAQNGGALFGRSLGALLLHELRSMPADELRGRANARKLRTDMIVDGFLIRDQPCKLALSRHIAKMPLIAGFTEQGYFSTGMFSDVVGPEAYEHRITDLFGAGSTVILALFPKKDCLNSIALQERAGMPAILASDLSVYAGSPGYLYLFSKSQGGNRPAFHTSDVAFVFNNLSSSARYSENMRTPLRDSSTLALADAMSDYWVSFAKSGMPVSVRNPTWNPYSAKHGSLMEFDRQIRMTSFSQQTRSASVRAE